MQRSAISGITDYGKVRVVLDQGAGAPDGTVPATAFIQDLSGLQPLDADLTTIAAQTGTGVEVRTGSGTWALRTITGTANQITVTNGDGVSGNPTLSLPVGTILTGTYTPTGFASTNVDSVTPGVAWYARIGDKCIGGGLVTVDFTAGGGLASDWGLSLPIASAFANSTDAAGSGGNFSANASPMALQANATNDRFFCRAYSPNALANSYAYTFIYTII